MKTLLRNQPSKKWEAVESADYIAEHELQRLLAQSLHLRGYEHNPGFLRFVETSKLPFRAHEHFKKADLDARQELYVQLAEKVWSTERLREV